jgi:curli biogenesis system outer membrane secretion channel CsgG
VIKTERILGIVMAAERAAPHVLTLARIILTLVSALATVAATISPVAAKEERVVAAVLGVNTTVLEQTWQFQFSPDQLGPLAASMLTSELASHSAFRVVERSYIEQVLEEQDRSASARFDPASAAKVGWMLGAQVVIVGDIHSFGRRKTDASGVSRIIPGNKGKIIGGVLNRDEVSARIVARVVNASTGEILAEAEAEGDVSSSAIGGILDRYTNGAAGQVSSQQVEGAASEVLREAVQNLAKALAEKASEFDLPPILLCLDGAVAAVAGSQVYLTLGVDTGALSGDYFEVKPAAVHDFATLIWACT